MTKKNTQISKMNSRVGNYSAIATVVLTIVTFGFALAAIPISGANCPADCMGYPYLETLNQYPRDFIWMYLALFMLIAYLVLMISIHYHVEEHKKILSQIGVYFALMSALVLLTNYFVQAFVVPMSLMSGENEGLPLLIQYNSHGIFLILEELGYILMGVSFLFAAISLSDSSRQESAIKWIFSIGFLLVVISFAAFISVYGMERLDRFEVVAISIDWIVLIINGVLLSKFFRKQLIN